MIELIYDRTASDMQEARALLGGGRLLPQRLKGCYDHIDRNRVGHAVNRLADWMNDNGGATTVTGKTDWTQASLPTREDNAAMLASVRQLRADFGVGVSELPVSLDAMDYRDANALEKALHELQEMTKT